ncbi:MAG: MFS transporter [Candidatus Rokubacteria bacterium]|nr:MFS transporter [Candidatus Rokubacteria bacterium]
MFDRLRRLHPFQAPDSQRLAVLFGIVYFAQGMWYLPNQTITITFKDQGLGAGQAATFFSITTVPWLVKPVYGLVSDFVPLFGRRRKSYLILTSGLAAACGLALAGGDHGYGRMALFFTAMGLGLAFTDVLVDALMVENGRPRGLTGAFQSVQWAAIYTSTVVVGLLGGWLAEHRRLALAFGIAALFPLVTLTLVTLFVQEAPAPAERETVRRTWLAVRGALGERDVWVVAGFILFFTFSPSFGPALIYYQTDHLGFSQQFIGVLGALSAASAVAGAAIYAPLSRRVPLERLIRLAITLAVMGTLAYLLYRGPASAVVIDVLFGGVGMITQLAFLDLAAKACPRGVEATFFALLMSVYNGGVQISQVTGGYLYDWLGYTPLVLVSAALTAAAFLLVPLVRIPRIESRAAAAVVP